MSVVYGVLVVCGACLAAVGGLALVQRLVPVPIRMKQNDVAGFIYAVLGVIYAVLLALVVIATWEEFGRARITAEAEANALAEIFWLAHQLPEPEGRELQELCRSYAVEMLDDEWPLMEQGRTLMEETEGVTQGWVLIDDIRATVQATNRRAAAGEQLYAEGLDQVQRLADARRTRLVVAEEGLPTVLWVVLIVGGIVVVGFAYLFGMENTVAHALMVAALAGVIAAGAVYHRRHGLSLLWGRPSWPRGLRACAGEVRDEQSQRTLRTSASKTVGTGVVSAPWMPRATRTSENSIILGIWLYRSRRRVGPDGLGEHIRIRRGGARPTSPS